MKMVKQMVEQIIEVFSENEWWDVNMRIDISHCTALCVKASRLLLLLLTGLTVITLFC